MTYKEAINYITTSPKFGKIAGLQRIERLLELLGNPQKQLKFVHVAGTNGKGSVCACIHSVLMDAGYKTGLFISPHLQRFSERIRVDKTEVTEDEIIKYAELVRQKADIMIHEGSESPTEFEIITAMSMLHFSAKACDIVVLEVGIGGIVDSTNIISENESLLSVITSIGFDHMDYLGETLPEIASKKAGIIKNNHTTIVYPAKNSVMEVFERTCTEKNARLIKLDEHGISIKSMRLNGTTFDIKGFDEIGDIEIKLLGKYGVYNAALAVLACVELRGKGFDISDKNIKDGLVSARWPGRLEVVNNTPIVIIDGAHNPEGANALLSELSAYFAGYKLTFICGCMADKDATALFAPFAPIAKRFITLTPDMSRAMPGDELMEKIKVFHDKVEFKESVREALDYAISTSDPYDIICAVGSLYFMGGVRDYFGLE